MELLCRRGSTGQDQGILKNACITLVVGISALGLRIDSVNSAQVDELGCA